MKEQQRKMTLPPILEDVDWSQMKARIYGGLEEEEEQRCCGSHVNSLSSLLVTVTSFQRDAGQMMGGQYTKACLLLVWEWDPSTEVGPWCF